jgi:hypothetical protein
MLNQTYQYQQGLDMFDTTDTCCEIAVMKMYTYVWGYKKQTNKEYRHNLWTSFK